MALRQVSFVRAQHWAVATAPFVLQVLFLSLGTVFLFDVICRAVSEKWLAPLAYTGAISYELYLLHAFVFAAIFAGALSYVRIAAFFLLSFAIAIPFYLLWHRAEAGIQCLLKKEKERRKS